MVHSELLTNNNWHLQFIKWNFPPSKILTFKSFFDFLTNAVSTSPLVLKNPWVAVSNFLWPLRSKYMTQLFLDGADPDSVGTGLIIVVISSSTKFQICISRTFLIFIVVVLFHASINLWEFWPVHHWYVTGFYLVMFLFNVLDNLRQTSYMTGIFPKLTVALLTWLVILALDISKISLVSPR